MPDPIIPVSPYEQGSLFLSNFLRGQLGAAGRAVVAPHTLSPKELESLIKTAAEKEGKTQKATGVSKILKGILGNPLVWVGVMMAMKNPPLTAQQLGKIHPKFQNFIGPFRKFVGTPEQIFGKKTADMFTKVANISKGYIDGLWKGGKEVFGYGTKYGTAILKAKGMAGRDLTKAEEMVVGLYRDGAHLGAGAKGAHLANRMRTIAEKFPDYVKAGAIPTDPIVVRSTLNQILAQRPWLKSLADAETAIYKSVWKDLPPKVHKTIAQILKMRGIEIGGEIRSNYLPYIVQLDRPAMMQALQSTLSRKAYVEGIVSQIQNVAPGSLMPRGLNLIPHLDDLTEVSKEFPGLLNPKAVPTLQKFVDYTVQSVGTQAEGVVRTAKGSREMVQALKEQWGVSMNMTTEQADRVSRHIAKLTDEFGVEFGVTNVRSMTETLMGGVKQYRLPSSYVMSRYLHQMAPAVAWNTDGIGHTILNQRALQPDSLRGTFDNYVLLLRGRRTWRQFTMDRMWNEFKVSSSNWLEKGPGAKIKEMAPGTHKWLADIFSANRPSTTFGGMSARLATWFYMSTMGFNPGPPIKNLMQPIITTQSLIGTRPTVEALRTIAPKVRSYMSLVAGGMDDVAAIRKAFPAFARSGLAPAPLTREMLAGTAAAGRGSIPGLGKTGKGLAALQRKALWLFSKSELWNRVFSYEAGIQHAAATGMKGVAASQFATRLTSMTQFPGGPLGIPAGLMNVPGPFRQFMHFPLRYTNFLMHSTRLGGEATRNWGTVGRSLAASAGLYEVAKGAGADLSAGLFYGALPIPMYEGAPFHPFPLVPPLVSTVGSVAQAALSGDPRKLGDAATMLVPGGIAAKRAWRALGPKYARFSNRGPDGRVPVYNDKGSLVARYTPLQLYGKALGIRSMDDRTEQSLTKYLLRQRDHIRGYRNEYLEALARNDVQKADSIAAEFAERYPDLGPLQVKKSDIKAISTRHNMSRVRRIMKGLSKEHRPQFSRIVNAALSDEMIGAMETSPTSMQHFFPNAVPSQTSGGVGFPVSATAPKPPYPASPPAPVAPMTGF